MKKTVASKILASAKASKPAKSAAAKTLAKASRKK